jgi:hypothetical protein
MRESTEIYPRTAGSVATNHLVEDQGWPSGGVDRHQRAADASMAEAL